MRLSIKLGEIKFMRLITKANTDNLYMTIYSSIDSVQERYTKDNGTKVMLWGTKNKKISRVFYFPTQDFNIPKNSIGDIVSLLASLIVTFMPSISAGAILSLIS